jgi:hypothetical protein
MRGSLGKTEREVCLLDATKKKKKDTLQNVLVVIASGHPVTTLWDKGILCRFGVFFSAGRCFSFSHFYLILWLQADRKADIKRLTLDPVTGFSEQ